MKLQAIRKFMSRLWERINISWAQAADMQRRIEEGRSEHAQKYLYWRM